MKKRKRPVRMVTLIAAVMVVLLAEAGLVAAVFISPTISTRLERVVTSAERAWNGTDGSPGIQARVTGALDRAYDRWIAPMWSQQQSPEGGGDFARCVSCHTSYAARRRFSSVYFNHPLHAQLRVECVTCHTETAHPNPPSPEERVCAKCHREVEQRGKCGLCHPPASLPHFYLLGAPREGPVECDVCHPKKSFTTHATQPLVDVGAFNGADRTLCASCHAVSTCERCHGAPHPSNWMRTHGETVGWGGQAACFSCHTDTWCADRCHTATLLNPFEPKPVPTGGSP